MFLCSFSRSLSYSLSLSQVVPKFVSPEMQDEANVRMKAMLEDAYKEAKTILVRNRKALDALIDALMAEDTLDGGRIREIVEREGAEVDLKKRREHVERGGEDYFL